MGELPGVVGTMKGVRRAFGAGQIGRCGAGIDEDLILVLGYGGDRQRNRGIGNVENGINAVFIIPFAGFLRCKVRVIAMVCPCDGHIEAFRCGAEIVDRRVGFNVRAHDGIDLIGEGRHERFVVGWDKFNTRVAAKAAEFARVA